MRHTYIVEKDTPADYYKTEQYIHELCEKYACLERGVIGKSYIGRNIGVLKFGEGEKKALYVGVHHASEWITGMLLMRFLEDLAECTSTGKKFYGIDTRTLYMNRTLYVVPMLNPDGAELAINGLKQSDFMYERLLCFNNNSGDFTRWQANGRGVDLNHNYNAGWDKARAEEIAVGVTGPGPTRYGGEYPESEREVAALTSFVRSQEDINLLLALHTQGEVIYWNYGDYYVEGAQRIGEAISCATGYLLDTPDGVAAHAGCKDWFIEEFRKPGFTIECGKGTNPLPISDFLSIYGNIVEALAVCMTM